MTGLQGLSLADAVAARRSVREFIDKPVPSDTIDYAISLAALSPAPHHSSPWRFAILTEGRERASLADAMGDAWRHDLESDGLDEGRVRRVLERSRRLLTGAPLLVIAAADMTRSHAYPDERRRLAEWTLFAHSVGAALQTMMLALAEKGVASCWLSAPVFCRDVVKAHLGLPPKVEPQALVLAGYASPAYDPRPRPVPVPADYKVSH